MWSFENLFWHLHPPQAQLQWWMAEVQEFVKHMLVYFYMCLGIIHKTVVSKQSLFYVDWILFIFTFCTVFENVGCCNWTAKVHTFNILWRGVEWLGYNPQKDRQAKVRILIRPAEKGIWAWVWIKSVTNNIWFLSRYETPEIVEWTANSLSVQSFSRASVILNLSELPCPGGFPATFRLSVVPRPWSMIVSITVRLFLNGFPKKAHHLRKETDIY